MRRHISLYILFTVVTLLLTGCNSKSVSRVFDADMETTWGAVLSVTERMSTESPASVDISTRKIITGWTYGNIQEGRGDGLAVTRSAEIWRGIITCERSGARTRVIVNIQKGHANTGDTGVPGRDRDSTVGFTLSSNNTEHQNRFLDAVAAELSKPGEES